VQRPAQEVLGFDGTVPHNSKSKTKTKTKIKNQKSHQSPPPTNTLLNVSVHHASALPLPRRSKVNTLCAASEKEQR
jgi:hypothetical protein